MELRIKLLPIQRTHHALAAFIQHVGVNHRGRNIRMTVHAYVLMTNHVHLLVTPETESSLSKTMQSIGRRYVQYFNHVYGRTGTLWEGRYKSTLIDSERYLLTCMRYIELNPVRAEMLAHPGDYPWSSYRANAGQ